MPALRPPNSGPAPLRTAAERIAALRAHVAAPNAGFPAAGLSRADVPHSPRRLGGWVPGADLDPPMPSGHPTSTDGDDTPTHPTSTDDDDTPAHRQQAPTAPLAVAWDDHRRADDRWADDKWADDKWADEQWAAGDKSDGPEPTALQRLWQRPRVRRLGENWVPEPLRDSRIDPGRRGALILSLIAAVAAVAAAIGVWRDRPQPRPVQPATSSVAASGFPQIPAAESATPPGSPEAAAAQRVSQSAIQAPAKTSAPAPTPTVIAVSVTGLVVHPGLVQVPADSRVADAIAAAGGVADGGSVTGLNLAAPLADGDSVVVGAEPAGPPTGSGPAAGGSAGSAGAGVGGGESSPGLVNLNTADAATLETLPGVGPVMAGNIIAWRETNGTFTSVDQLQEVSGIGPSRFAQLQPLVTVG